MEFAALKIVLIEFVLYYLTVYTARKVAEKLKEKRAAIQIIQQP